eukprot:14851891-Alexandrium_andersonii.AAC.1
MWGEAVTRSDADLIAQCVASSTLPPPTDAPSGATGIADGRGGARLGPGVVRPTAAAVPGEA